MDLPVRAEQYSCDWRQLIAGERISNFMSDRLQTLPAVMLKQGEQFIKFLV